MTRFFDLLPVMFVALGFSSIFYGPWVLVRVGWYKLWYLAPALPSLIYGRAIYGWPICAVFIAPPFVALFPTPPEDIIIYIGIISIIATIWMIIWTPAWAKPFWQRYLESTYSYGEISGVFLPAWRKMDRREWSKKMDTKEGIEELVAYARQGRGKGFG
ncbi:MAG: hypothetical protein OT477_14065 [Chloroflexi bacterium]|nr:hypothetical protein [Chloroflexota bacterium]